jgi:hypothetical protein
MTKLIGAFSLILCQRAAKTMLRFHTSPTCVAKKHSYIIRALFVFGATQVAYMKSRCGDRSLTDKFSSALGAWVNEANTEEGNFTPGI